jgi:hypothetical protein
LALSSRLKHPTLSECQCKEDRIESLELSTQALEVEKAQLKAILGETKEALRGKKAELADKLPRNDSTRRMRAMRKKKDMKKG